MLPTSLSALTIALSLVIAGPPQMPPPYIPPAPPGPVPPPYIPPHLAGGGASHGPGHAGHTFGHHHERGFILPPGPGLGWGFKNNAPDDYGWYEIGPFLPISTDRSTSYYFRRYMAVPPQTMFLPTYYNPYLTRGQRYIPYTGCGGLHPAGVPVSLEASRTAVVPYDDLSRSRPIVPVPEFSGEVQAAPVNPSQGEDLIP